MSKDYNLPSKFKYSTDYDKYVKLDEEGKPYVEWGKISVPKYNTNESSRYYGKKVGTTTTDAVFVGDTLTSLPKDGSGFTYIKKDQLVNIANITTEFKYKFPDLPTNSSNTLIQNLYSRNDTLPTTLSEASGAEIYLDGSFYALNSTDGNYSLSYVPPKKDWFGDLLGKVAPLIVGAGFGAALSPILSGSATATSISSATGLSNAVVGSALSSALVQGGMTALQGGDGSDILKSAITGGITSGISQTLGKTFGTNVTNKAVASGLVEKGSLAQDILTRASTGLVVSGTSAALRSALYGTDFDLDNLVSGTLSGAVAGTASNRILAELTKTIPEIKDLPKSVQDAIGTSITAGLQGKDISSDFVLNSIIKSTIDSIKTNLKNQTSLYQASDKLNLISKKIDDTFNLYKSSLPASISEEERNDLAITRDFNTHVSDLSLEIQVEERSLIGTLDEYSDSDLLARSDAGEDISSDLTSAYRNANTSFTQSAGYTKIGSEGGWDLFVDSQGNYSAIDPSGTQSYNDNTILETLRAQTDFADLPEQFNSILSASGGNINNIVPLLPRMALKDSTTNDADFVFETQIFYDKATKETYTINAHGDYFVTDSAGVTTQVYDATPPKKEVELPKDQPVIIKPVEETTVKEITPTTTELVSQTTPTDQEVTEQVISQLPPSEFVLDTVQAGSIEPPPLDITTIADLDTELDYEATSLLTGQELVDHIISGDLDREISSANIETAPPEFTTLDTLDEALDYGVGTAISGQDIVDQINNIYDLDLGTTASSANIETTPPDQAAINTAINGIALGFGDVDSGGSSNGNGSGGDNILDTTNATNGGTDMSFEDGDYGTDTDLDSTDTDLDSTDSLVSMDDGLGVDDGVNLANFDTNVNTASSGEDSTDADYASYLSNLDDEDNTGEASFLSSLDDASQGQWGNIWRTLQTGLGGQVGGDLFRYLVAQSAANRWGGVQVDPYKDYRATDEIPMMRKAGQTAIGTDTAPGGLLDMYSKSFTDPVGTYNKPEMQALSGQFMNQIQRRDAAAGRNSQYGARAVEAQNQYLTSALPKYRSDMLGGLTELFKTARPQPNDPRANQTLAEAQISADTAASTTMVNAGRKLFNIFG